MEKAAETLKFRVGGMDCAACVTKIENAVGRLPGVETVNVSLTAGTMTVEPSAQVSRAAVEQKVKALGYTIGAHGQAAPEGDEAHDHADHDHGDHAHEPAHGEPLDGPWWRTRKAMLTAVCGLALILAYTLGFLVPAIGPWAFLLALAIGLVPVARRAIVAAFNGTPFSIEMLMTIAAVGAVFIGAAEEAAMVVFLFL